MGWSVMRTLHSTSKKKVELSSGDVAEKIYSAILGHSIRPGTKLGEERLSVIFSVSRARVRDALSLLAYKRVVDLVPHQGAYVSKPDIQEAKDVFSARKLIEPFLVRSLCASLTDDKVEALRKQVSKEAKAHNTGDLPGMIRLSGEFHVVLAELAGNSSLLRTMHELTSRTCLIISLYSPSTKSSCRSDQHADIVDAIIDRKDSVASDLIVSHLDCTLESLRAQAVPSNVSLEELFI